MTATDTVTPWRTQAACAGHDPADFDPHGTDDLPTQHRALAVCEGCPVRPDCLTAALTAHPRPRGAVWGGRYFDDDGRDHRIAVPGDRCLTHGVPPGWTTYNTLRCRCDVWCCKHRPVGPDGEFVWDDGSGEKVGT